MGVNGRATDWEEGSVVQPIQSALNKAAKSHAAAWLFKGMWVRVMW